MPKELATGLEICDEVEIGVRLEGELEADEKGGLERALEDFALADGVCDLLLCDDLLLGKDLHCVNPAGVALADLENFSKGATADELEKLEVARGEWAAGLSMVREHTYRGTISTLCCS